MYNNLPHTNTQQVNSAVSVLNSNKSLLVKLAIVLFLLIAGWLVFKSLFSSPTLVSVTSTGKVMASPSQVKFQVVVLNTAGSNIQAFTDNKSLTRGLIAILKSNGIEDKDIDSAYTRVVDSGVSFQAINSIQVTYSDINAFDDLVMQLYSNGASSISSIVFTTPDSQDLERQAVTLAIQEAKTRAKELAKSSNKRLGKMVSLATGEVGEAGAISGSSSDSLNSSDSSPTQIEITRQVNIVFELR